MSSQFPEARPRRLRRNASLRSLFQETEFSLNDLVLPIFVEEDIDDFVPITSMPGVQRIPERKLASEIERYARAGIKSVMTFGVSHHLDANGSDTWKERGLVSRMSSIIKDAVPEMIVMSDTCFCEYTDHGHCGIIKKEGKSGYEVDNDATLDIIRKTALVQAEAGADFVARSPTISIASINPCPPRTSPMAECLAFNAFSPSNNCVPRAAAFSLTFKRLVSASVASAAAAPTGWPE